MSNQNQSKELDTSFIGWEQQTEEVDFFGTTTEVSTLIPEDEVPAKLDAEEKEPSEKPKSETPEEDSFFGVEEEPEKPFSHAEEEEEEEREEEIPDEEEEEGSSGHIGALNLLKEKGLLDYELEEGEELTEEKAAAFIEDNYEASIEERVGELFQELPQVVKDLNKFVLDGGDIRSFLGSFVKDSGVSSDMDISQEANQELVMRNALKEEEYDDDYIETHIEFLKDTKKLEKFAKAKLEKKKKEEDKAREAMVKQQEAAKQAQKETLRKLKSSVTSNLKEINDVEGIPLTKADKKDLPSYMVDRNVKLDNGGSITAMQMDLMEALKDEKKALFIAKLLKTDFDLSTIQAKAQTEVTKKVKDGIRRNKKDTKNVRSTGSGATSAGKKSLSDYF
jgi:hypothetical protein